MSQRISRRQVIAGSAAAGTLLGAQAFRARALAESSGPIRFGMVLPLTGPVAVSGRGWLDGARIAAEQINANGGINGRPIELVERDDKLNPNNTIAHLRELAGQGVNFFHGGIWTALTLAVLPVITEQNVLWSTSAVADALTHQSFNPNFFRIGDNNYMRMRTMAKIMATRHPDITEWGTMMFDNATSHDSWIAFEAGLKHYYPQIAQKPVGITEPILVKTDVSDFRNQIVSLLQSPPRGIYLGIAGSQEITFFQQARSFNLHDKIKVYTDLGQDVDLGKQVGKDMPPEIWSTSYWYEPAYRGNPLSDGLYKAFKLRNPNEEPGSIVGLGHAMINVYAAGIGKAQSTETAAVRAALEGISVETCKGNIHIRAEDHQGIADITSIMMGAAGNDAGWAVLDAIRTAGTEAADPPSPGKAIAYS